MTIYDMAEARGIKKFDSAMPQGWVNAMRSELNTDVRGHFVWSYEGPSLFGAPVPISGFGDYVALMHPDYM